MALELDLATPAFLVDLDQAERNCAAMRARAERLGVGLRPHFKTHKTLELAKLMTAGDAAPKITVSTLAEAEFLAGDAYFQDILFAVPLAPTEAQLARVRALQRRVPRFHVLVDSAHAVDALLAEPQDPPLSVFLKVDTGYGRFGVLPDSAEAAELPRRLAAGPGTAFAGLYSHSGHAYGETTPEGVAAVAEQERARVVAVAERLRAQGVAVPEVSVGSTPSCVHAASLEGCTEMHPGNYVFFDLQQASISSCRPADVAVSVLTTVLSHSRERNQVMVDAGGTALHKDRAALDSWGAVVGHPELTLARISQECGALTSDQPIDFAAVPIGSQLRILPNHACMTAAGHARYHVMRGGELTGEAYAPVGGW